MQIGISGLIHPFQVTAAAAVASAPVLDSEASEKELHWDRSRRGDEADPVERPMPCPDDPLARARNLRLRTSVQVSVSQCVMARDSDLTTLVSGHLRYLSLGSSLIGPGSFP